MKYIILILALFVLACGDAADVDTRELELNEPARFEVLCTWSPDPDQWWLFKEDKDAGKMNLVDQGTCPTACEPGVFHEIYERNVPKCR